jgi:hypothetical protein
MRSYESELQTALHTYRSLDRALTNARLHGAIPEYADMTQLEVLRDEAFRMIDFYCVDHIVAVEDLKEELNLETDYDKS